jgi:hypothetical protein
MPKLIVPLSDLDQLVTRPIITHVVEQIKVQTQLPKDTIVWYPGEDGSTYQPKTPIQDDPNYVQPEGSMQANRMGTNQQVTIDVVEEFDSNYTLTGVLFKPEYPFLFKDPALGVFMKPGYARTTVTMQIKFRAQSETQSMNWRNLMRQRIIGQADVRIYDLTYSYYVSPTYLTILQELYALRENIAGYGDTFDEYVRAHLVPKATQISDLAGNAANLRWVIPETQIRVPGWWDFDGYPERGQRDEKSGTWTSTIAFKFSYDRPYTQVMFYPLMVHNQLIPKKWRPDMRSWESRHPNPGYSLTAKALLPFEGNLSRVPNPITEGYRIPWFDEFVPQTIVPQTKNVIQALISIDQSNPQALFSLKDMGSFVLDKDIQAFMVGEAPYMTQVGQSVFSLVLYQGNMMATDSALSVDSDLNVTTTWNLDLRQVYHIRLALHYDLCGINPAAQQRLQQHCEAARKIIDALDGRIKLRPGLPVCLPNDTMKRSDYLLMNSIINARKSRDGQGNSYLPSYLGTVATLFVELASRSQLEAEREAIRLEQRRRMMMCLSTRAAIPDPEGAKLEAEEELKEELSSAEDVMSTGEHWEDWCSTGEWD